MIDQKLQFRLYTILALALGITLIAGLIKHDHSFHTWLKLAAFICFTVAAVQAYRTQHASKSPA